MSQVSGCQWSSQIHIRRTPLTRCTRRLCLLRGPGGRPLPNDATRPPPRAGSGSGSGCLSLVLVLIVVPTPDRVHRLAARLPVNAQSPQHSVSRSRTASSFWNFNDFSCLVGPTRRQGGRFRLDARLGRASTRAKVGRLAELGTRKSDEMLHSVMIASGYSNLFLSLRDSANVRGLDGEQRPVLAGVRLGQHTVRWQQLEQLRAVPTQRSASNTLPTLPTAARRLAHHHRERRGPAAALAHNWAWA